MDRRGFTNQQIIIGLVLIIIVGAFAFKGLTPQPSQTPDNTSTGDKTQPSHQEIRVTDIILDETVVPSGVPISVKVLLERISGEDPFPITLSVSGTPYKDTYITFGESNHAEAHFRVILTRQGRYEAHVMDVRREFEVRVMPVEVEWVDVSPREAEPNENVTITFRARNINNITVADEVYVVALPEIFNYPVSPPPLEAETFNFTIRRDHPGEYNISIEGVSASFTILDTHSNTSNDEFQWSPIEWQPDPATWNMTSLLPPEASTVRLSLPVPIESLFGHEYAGIGGMGLHAGGHIEGLDHVWIESLTTEPIRSWADGTVESVQYSGDVENGEYHIGINYGDNLVGFHMEIETPLVEVGDHVKRGEPVGYGMSFFSGIQSAEFALIDSGRSDGIYSGNGVYVPPFDYLVDSEKVALAEAYIENVIQPYVLYGARNGMFDPAQPYFTNRLLIHHNHEGRLQGEWYIVSGNWSSGYPNDMITIIEAETPYYSGAKILGMDDTSEGGVSNWNLNSELTIDYTTGRVHFSSWTGQTLYGIFSIDETGERARLTIQYQTGGYPSGFTEDALVYVERSYIPRRMDGVELGVAQW